MFCYCSKKSKQHFNGRTFLLFGPISSICARCLYAVKSLLWHIWQSGCFRSYRSALRNPVIGNSYLLSIVMKRRKIISTLAVYWLRHTLAQWSLPTSDNPIRVHIQSLTIFTYKMLFYNMKRQKRSL